MSNLRRSVVILPFLKLSHDSSRDAVLTGGNVIYSIRIIKLSNTYPRYVVRLENRLEKLEALLNMVHLAPCPPPFLIHPQFCPDQQVLEEFRASELDIESTNRTSTSSFQLSSPTGNVATSTTRNANNPKFLSPDPNSRAHAVAPNEVDELVQGVSAMGIQNPHFIGKSSSAILAEDAFQVKKAYTGIASNALNSRRQEFWSVSPVSYLSPLPP